MQRRSLLILLTSLLAGCSEKPATPAGSARLTIAAAASLRPALEEAVTEFQKAHPDITIAATYGASGTFYAQLTQRAPFDLFLSADTDYPRKLVAAAHAESDFAFAAGRLALWVPPDSPLHPDRDGLRSLTDASVLKIAIANPVLAPYGRAAEEALRHAGLYEAVKAKLVPAENVAQAAQFVQSGAAQAGLVALSLTLTKPMRSGKAWTVPAEYHAPLVHSGVILPWTPQRVAAEKFRDWLLSKEGQAVLGRHGFTSPADERLR